MLSMSGYTSTKDCNAIASVLPALDIIFKTCFYQIIIINNSRTLMCIFFLGYV